MRGRHSPCGPALPPKRSPPLAAVPLPKNNPRMACRGGSSTHVAAQNSEEARFGSGNPRSPMRCPLAVPRPAPTAAPTHSAGGAVEDGECGARGCGLRRRQGVWRCSHTPARENGPQRSNGPQRRGGGGGASNRLVPKRGLQSNETAGGCGSPSTDSPAWKAVYRGHSGHVFCAIQTLSVAGGLTCGGGAVQAEWVWVGAWGADSRMAARTHAHRHRSRTATIRRGRTAGNRACPVRADPSRVDIGAIGRLQCTSEPCSAGAATCPTGVRVP